MGQIQTSVPAPTGLAYHAGTNLFCVPNWSAGSPYVYIYKIDPATGATVSTIPSPSSWPGGITCVGDTLWVTDYLGGMQIFKISFQTGAVYAMYSIPYSAYWAGCAWDGQYVYYGNNTTDLIYKMNPNTGATVGTIPVPIGGGIAGLTYYDGHLYYSENDGDMLYKITMAGVIVDSSPAPTGWPSGVEVVDGYLWNVEYYSAVIYKFEIAPVVHNVTIDLTYVSGPPILVYDVTVTNNEAMSVTFDAWLTVTIPTGAEIVLVNRELTLAGGATVSRQLTLNVPATAPPGTYTMTGKVGDYPSMVWDSDSFTFTVPVAGDGSAAAKFDPATWTLTGWDEPWGEVTDAAVPTGFSVLGNYPNPFNPSTTISYTMPQASQVSLKVYNTAGQLVAALVNGYREAGWHQVTWDASNLATGLYIYRLEAGGQTFNQKAMLVK